MRCVLMSLIYFCYEHGLKLHLPMKVSSYYSILVVQFTTQKYKGKNIRLLLLMEEQK